MFKGLDVVGFGGLGVVIVGVVNFSEN